MKKNNITLVLTPLVIAITFVAGLWIGIRLSIPEEPTSGQQKLMEILNLVETKYVDKVNIDSLIEKSIPEILANLDPHTIYISSNDIEVTNSELQGSFGGVGISFSLLTDTITVLEVISGGPAEDVGILAGDRIVKIDGEQVAGVGLSNEDVFSKLRGDRGTLVTLGIKRNNTSKILEFEVTRGDIPITSVNASYMISPEIGYVNVTSFSSKTYEEFIIALNTLRNRGANSYIIDLRGNGGGFMEMAALMANEFLPRGMNIVNTIGREPEQCSTIFSDGSGSFQMNKVVVLIDEYSASASEILAGAMQDNDRGLIIGRRSFGKGLVQNQISLSDSSAIRLTVARYYTPSGRCIQKEYKPGEMENYNNDILERFNHGEAFVADSIKLNTDLEYNTAHGRKVYGGGGIMPDIFVPNDTSGITSYYINVSNAGLLQKFAFEYCDLNRVDLNSCENVTELLKHLPSDDILIQSFASYAAQDGINPRWYYIGISRDLILYQIKALIARDILGTGAYYEVFNDYDVTIKAAIKALRDGKADYPIRHTSNAQ